MIINDDVTYDLTIPNPLW